MPSTLNPVHQGGGPPREVSSMELDREDVEGGDVVGEMRPARARAATGARRTLRRASSVMDLPGPKHAGQAWRAWSGLKHHPVISCIAITCALVCACIVIFKQDLLHPDVTPPALYIKPGQPCTRDMHCADVQGMCLNWEPHTSPYVCSTTHKPVCANALSCQHSGQPFELRCKSDADCPQNLAGRSTCSTHGYCDVPAKSNLTTSSVLCGCACVSNWVGESCQTWNTSDGAGGSTVARRGRALSGRALTAAAAQSAAASGFQGSVGAAAAAAGPNSYIAPFNGGLGYGYSSKSGDTLKPPLIELSYSQAQPTYRGHRLPDQATVSIQDRFNGNVQTWGWPTWYDYRTALEREWNSVKAADGSGQYQDVFTMSGGPGAFSTYFKGDLALGVAMVQFDAFTASFKNGGTDSSLRLSRYAAYAAGALPDSAADAASASGKAAYNSFLDNFGDRYVVKTHSGGLAGIHSKFPFELVRTANAVSSTAFETSARELLEADLTIAVGLGGDGATASSSDTSNAHDVLKETPVYTSGRRLDPAFCMGGDPTKCNGASTFPDWAKSIWDAPAPIQIGTLPIYQLPGLSAVAKSTLEGLVNQQTSDVEAAVNDVNGCAISCGHGTHCSGNVCGCNANEMGRLCNSCKGGYSRRLEGLLEAVAEPADAAPDAEAEAGDEAGARRLANCLAPVCTQGCNAAGGHCTSPNVCTCENCYAGSNCMTYTCGCFDASGTVSREGDAAPVPVGDVRVGDRVLSVDAASGKATYSDVYYVSSSAGAARMVDLALEGGAQLRLTDHHLVYLVPSEAAARGYAGLAYGPATAAPVEAGRVKRGDIMWQVDAATGAPAARLVTGARADADEAAQLVTVHTLAGPVVVNGVAASSYEWSEAWGKLENAEARAVYTWLPAVAKSEVYQAYARWWDDNVVVPVLDPLARAVSSRLTALLGPAAATPATASPMAAPLVAATSA